MKRRLDILLVERGLAESRTRAQALVMEGKVRVAGQTEYKASRQVDDETPVEIESPPRFVSRGGEKLEGAFGLWGTYPPSEASRRRRCPSRGGNGLVCFADDPAAAEGGFLSSAGLSGRDTLEVSAHGNGERVVLVARFDNLGKGASGAAIQNMNLVLGCAEDEGLVR